MKTRSTCWKNGIKSAILLISLFLVKPSAYLFADQPATVYDVISGSTDHSTLKTAIDAAGLASTLQGTGPFTVFAPTNEAFAALPAGTIDALLADPTGALKDILLYHVVGAKALSTDLSNGQMITTAEGKKVEVTIKNDSVFINDALVTVADLMADNGVVHVINAVLIPPAVTVYDVIAGSADHTLLKTAIDTAGLASTLQGTGPFTVFAPTNEAFAALPEGTIDALLADPTGALKDILLYHVVGSKALSTDLTNGQMITTAAGKDVEVTIKNDSVFINDALVTMADLMADNGVVHVINAVLVPSEVPTGIFDVKKASVEFYPNPAKNYIILQLEKDEETNVKILSMEGRVVRTFNQVSNGSRLELSGIKDGNYMLITTGGSKTSTSKLVIGE
jgi:uncharacterized surface protein with fasciclin (FAS1) repeats